MTDGKRDETPEGPEVPGAVADLLEDLLTEDALENVASLPAEERHARMRAEGLEPARAQAVVSEALAKRGVASPPAPPAPVVDLANARAQRARPARPAWTLLLIAAAVALVALGGGAAIVASRGPAPPPTPTLLPPPPPTAPPGPTPEEVAARQRAQAESLRALAVADCAGGHWSACDEHLEDATKLDPAGDEARLVKRLRGEARRELFRVDIDSKTGVGTRALRPSRTKDLVDALAPMQGQTLRLVCSPAGEPSGLCGQLAGVLRRAGWTVTRAPLAADAGALHGMVVEVATDASEATQAAADALVSALYDAYLVARGPHDAPPGGDAPLQLLVGPM